MDSLVYWIWLSLACIPGSTAFADLMKKFSDAEEIYNATDRQIRSCINPKISDCSALYDKSLERAEQVYTFCKQKGVGIVTYEDIDYPKLLRRIDNPPVLLYYRGKIPKWNDTFRCAIVGTRSLSSYGRKIAYNLGYDLAKLGWIVVSGMAKGIDAVSQVGALEGGGVTVAVLGSGIDVCYPSEHLTLAREIVKTGCIFTEYPPGTKPLRRNFPTRNRLISGMCDATVIVEADINSGAMITAHRAKDQKRQLFAVPSMADLYFRSGTNELIKNGARICSGVMDIVNDFCVPGGFVMRNPEALNTDPQTNFMSVLSKYKVVANTPDDNIYVPSGRREKPVNDFLPPRTKQEIAKVNEQLEDVSEPDEPTPAPVSAVASESTSKSESNPETKPKPKRKKSKGQQRLDEVNRQLEIYKEENFTSNDAIAGFSKDQIKIYKKIPREGDCPLESLLLEGMEMKTLMRYLLKMEMNRLIVVLPGDRVARRKNW